MKTRFGDKRVWGGFHIAVIVVRRRGERRRVVKARIGAVGDGEGRLDGGL